ncbi:NB-ARC domain-containing protein [Streptomyces sp. NPDC050732]|uniref:NB-ARC domain-containing protein n=1 Tax=Streptomyces sp. NPDC050732 TaxID=3154632 RepID=UPI00343FB07A
MDERTRNSVSGQAKIGTAVQTGRVEVLNVYGAPGTPEDSLVPHQMPPDVRHFEDRDAQRSRVLDIAARPRAAGRPLVVSVTGVHGVGKTALAVHLAHRLAAEHTYVVRYVDLDDHRPDGGADLADVMGELLRSFEVTDLLEGNPARRRKQYWEQTGKRRLVLILDNIRTGTEITQLLPSSAESVVVATSRQTLYDVEGGVDLELPVGPLEEPHAERLLHHIVDDPRLTADPASAAELTRICGGLPAALHVAAEWLRKHRTRRLARLTAQLAAELDAKGVPTVEAVWDAAYQDLTPGAGTLYRLLVEHPGPWIDPEAATALLGRGEDEAEDALDDLVRASLLARERDGRLRLHDLLRAHAARRADRERRAGAGTEAAEGRLRVIRWYLRQAQRADALRAGPRMTFADPVPHLPDTPDTDFGITAADSEKQRKAKALHWLEAHRLALHDCVRVAHAHGLDAEAWALCEPLWTHYMDHPRLTQVVNTFSTGRDAALRAGGPLTALIRMRCQLARPLWEQGRFDDAATELRLASAAAETLGDGTRERKLRASVIEFRGLLSSARGEWAAAAADFEASGRIHTEIGNAYGAMLQTYLLGKALTELGELSRAATLLTEAHTQAEATGRARLTARTGFALARVLRGLGRPGEAMALYDESLREARLSESLREELRALDALAELAAETGDATAATEFRTAARAVRERGGGLTEPGEASASSP